MIKILREQYERDKRIKAEIRSRNRFDEWDMEQIEEAVDDIEAYQKDIGKHFNSGGNCEQA